MKTEQEIKNTIEECKKNIEDMNINKFDNYYEMQNKKTNYQMFILALQWVLNEE